VGLWPRLHTDDSIRWAVLTVAPPAPYRASTPPARVVVSATGNAPLSAVRAQIPANELSFVLVRADGVDATGGPHRVKLIVVSLLPPSVSFREKIALGETSAVRRAQARARARTRARTPPPAPLSLPPDPPRRPW